MQEASIQRIQLQLPPNQSLLLMEDREMLGGRMMTKTNYGVTTANKSHHKREMCVGSCMGSCKDRAKGTSSSLTIAWIFKQLPNHQKLKLREIQGIQNLLYSPRSSQSICIGLRVNHKSVLILPHLLTQHKLVIFSLHFIHQNQTLGSLIQG